MKISDLTEFGIPVGGAVTGLLASKVLPSTLRLESTFTKGGFNIALGLGALLLAETKDGKAGDAMHYGGLALLSMGALELFKSYLPVGWQAGIAGGAYPTTYTYPSVAAYPAEVSTPALGDGVEMDGSGMDAYPYEGSVPIY